MAKQLTGEALFQMHRTMQPYDLDWSEIGTSGQAFYNSIAAQINAIAEHIQPSGRVLTGQAIHAIHEQREPAALPWDRISEKSQQEYNAIAEHINTAYLAPLQGLVRDWRKLLQEHDDLSVMSILEIDDWHQSWQELKKRTAQLLADEQKG